jgi:hypothetical protein
MVATKLQDCTIAAITESISHAIADDADDSLVFVLSDANLGRYSIAPDDLRVALQTDPKVTASIIFIAEPAAAGWLVGGAPGRAFVELDTANLPRLIKTIFARAVE